jgi:hypothetical protein
MDLRGWFDRLHRVPVRATRGLARPVLLGLLCLAGCSQTQIRQQSEEETEHDRYQVATVGEKTDVGNAEPVPVSGVGLVEGLDGTGGVAPPDEFRTMLEDDLRRQGELHIKELLSSPTNALVLVSALIPPGAHKNDKIDVEVSVPRNSKVTSLRGGHLRPCKLYNYDFTSRLSPTYNGPTQLLRGHPLVDAQGAVLVGLGSGDDDGRLRQGRIWDGGACKREQPLSLLMHADQRFARMTALIADRVNESLQPSLSGSHTGALAVATDNQAVYLNVPPQYKQNLPRYLRVVRLIPLQEPSEAPEAGKRTYRQRLAEDLHDPSRTVVAALRLEALGQRSLPTLKKALESKHPLVRFCAAEALLYLGSPAGAPEAALAALEQPLLRAYGLAALASLDEAVCQEKLADLIGVAHDDETRYGAFRALQSLDERHPAVRGERLNDAFWLHRTAPNTPPLVHVTTMKRAEIVLFGEEPFLKGPFGFLAGEFTITSAAHDKVCTISRIPLRSAPVRRQCSLKLDEVLRTMADMGAGYPEVVGLLQQADHCESLTCRVRLDAVPQAVSVYELVKAGRAAPGESELLPGGQDLGGTPTLYDTGRSLGVGPDHSAEGRKQGKADAKGHGSATEE